MPTLHWQTTLQGQSVLDGTVYTASAVETIPLYGGQQISVDYTVSDNGQAWIRIDGTGVAVSGNNTTGTLTYTAPAGVHEVFIVADPGDVGTAYANNILIPRSGTPH